MEAKRKKFEKELKSKIQQKLKGKETEEAFLTKAFKFMDITGSGKVNFDQFFGAIGRMGFALEKPVRFLVESIISPLAGIAQPFCVVRHK